jgi:hypothetical protein
MFAVIDSTETESGYDSYVNLNENLTSSGMEEGRNGFEGVVDPAGLFAKCWVRFARPLRTPNGAQTPGGIR